MIHFHNKIPYYNINLKSLWKEEKVITDNFMLLFENIHFWILIHYHRNKLLNPIFSIVNSFFIWTRFYFFSLIPLLHSQLWNSKEELYLFYFLCLAQFLNLNRLIFLIISLLYQLIFLHQYKFKWYILFFNS